MQEIEAKLKIGADEKNKILDFCHKNNFVKHEPMVECDVYLSPGHKNIMKEDKALRVRRQGDRWKLTYKEANRSKLIQDREEIELEVDDGKKLLQIFEKLDFCSILEVYKERTYYTKENISICMDDVRGLGEYAEIEILDSEKSAGGDEKQIWRILEEMGLGKVQTERKTYLELLLYVTP